MDKSEISSRDLAANGHFIQNRYEFWYIPKTTAENFEYSLTSLGDFKTLEEFWMIYSHIKRSDDLPISDVFLFKSGIRPAWEDPANEGGGRLVLRIPKGRTAYLWEELLLGVIGERFDLGYELCGVQLSVRSHDNVLSIWNKSSANYGAIQKLREAFRRILNIPNEIYIDYKPHISTKFINRNIPHS